MFTTQIVQQTWVLFSIVEEGKFFSLTFSPPLIETMRSLSGVGVAIPRYMMVEIEPNYVSNPTMPS